MFKVLWADEKECLPIQIGADLVVIRVGIQHFWKMTMRLYRNSQLVYTSNSDLLICRYCHGPTECYNCMCEARRKASSGKALLLFLVTCMHDAMHAMCMLCAIWRTRDTVICGTEWFQMHDWTFWKVCERTRNPETLPDLPRLARLAPRHLELLIYKARSRSLSRRTRRE